MHSKAERAVLVFLIPSNPRAQKPLNARCLRLLQSALITRVVSYTGTINTFCARAHIEPAHDKRIPKRAEYAFPYMRLMWALLAYVKLF